MFKILAVMMVIQCATSMKRPFRSGDEEQKADGKVVVHKPENEVQEVYEYILNVAFGQIPKNVAAVLMSFKYSKHAILDSNVEQLWDRLGMFKDLPTHIRFQYTDVASLQRKTLLFPLCRNPRVTSTTRNLWDMENKPEFHCSPLTNGGARFSVVNKKKGYNEVLTCKIPSLCSDAGKNTMRMLTAPQFPFGGGAIPDVPANATAKFDYMVLNNGIPEMARWDGKTPTPKAKKVRKITLPLWDQEIKVSVTRIQKLR